MANNTQEDEIQVINGEQSQEALSYYYLGKRMPSHAPAETLESIKRYFEVRPDDIYIVTYVRSGTTMLGEMVNSISSIEDIDSLRNKSLTERVPFLDTGPGAGLDKPTYERIAASPSPRIICSHLPYEWMPVQFYDVMPKTIYLARDPRDVAVACWQFSKQYKYLDTIEKWEDYFDMFCSGDVIYGSWFNHVLGWWNRRHDDNMLFLKFEDVLAAPDDVVETIGDFLKVELSPEDKDKVLQQTSLHIGKLQGGNLSKTTTSNRYPLFKRGNVGVWKDHFTVAQNSYFNQLYFDTLKGTGLVLD
ncbi:sulfotransferase 1B1-like [Ptychodera flava]|uniref:sulfotransferase 1B1-like n=1 Tax=Ptychodera flava TaxID=63121 RepID=UPI00396AA10B